MVEPGHQGCFLAEIARQRHHLHVERVRNEAARDRQRGVCAAVIDIDDFAGEAVTLPQRARQTAQPLVQAGEASGLVIQRHDDRQSLRRGGRRGRGQSGNIATELHRSGSNKPYAQQHMLPAAGCRQDERKPGLIAAGRPPAWRKAGFRGPAHSPARRSKPCRRRGRAENCRARKAAPVGSAA